MAQLQFVNLPSINTTRRGDSGGKSSRGAGEGGSSSRGRRGRGGPAKRPHEDNDDAGHNDDAGNGGGADGAKRRRMDKGEDGPSKKAGLVESEALSTLHDVGYTDLSVVRIILSFTTIFLDDFFSFCGKMMDDI